MARWGNALGGWRKQPRTKGGQFGNKAGGSSKKKSTKKKTGNTRRYDAYLEYQKRQKKQARRENAKRVASTGASLAVAAGVLAYKNATPEQRQRAAKTAYNFARSAANRQKAPKAPKARTFQTSLNSAVRVSNVASSANPPKAYSPFSAPSGRDILRVARANRASAARSAAMGVSGRDVIRQSKVDAANRNWRATQGISPINLRKGAGPQLKIRRLSPGEAGAFRASQRAAAKRAGQNAVLQGQSLMQAYGQKLPKGKQMRPNRRDWTPKIRATAASNRAVDTGRSMMGQIAGQKALTSGRSLYTRTVRERRIAAINQRKNAGAAAAANVRRMMNPQLSLTAGKSKAGAAASRNMKSLMAGGTVLKSSGNVFAMSAPKAKVRQTGTMIVPVGSSGKNIVGLGRMKAAIQNQSFAEQNGQDALNALMGMAARIDRVGGRRTRKPKAAPGAPAPLKSALTVASTKPKTSTPKATKPKSAVPGAPTPLKSSPKVVTATPKRQLSPEQRQAAAAANVRPGIAKSMSPQNKYQAAEAKAKKELEAARSELKALRAEISGAEIAALALPSPAEDGITGREKTKRVAAQKSRMAAVAPQAKRADELSKMIKKIKYDMGWD